MNLSSDDFALFGLPRTFKQDPTLIDARRLDLQRLTHPDQFADQGMSAQRQAMQWSMRINEGWQRLKSPLKRAAYLCELGGAPVNANSAHGVTTSIPSEVLVQQMAWREDLESAQNADDVKHIGLQVDRAVHDALQNIVRLIDDQQDLQAACGQVRILMFLQRLAEDIHDRTAALGECQSQSASSDRQSV